MSWLAWGEPGRSSACQAPMRSAYWWFDLELAEQPDRSDGATGVVSHSLECARTDAPCLHLQMAADGGIQGAFWSPSSTLTDDSRSAVALPPAGSSELARAEEAYRLVHRCVMNEASAAGYARLHGALVRLAGTTMAILGPSGAGKSTLAVQLGLIGAEVLSDEGLFVRGGQALPLLRRVHLKDSARVHLPGHLFTAALRLPYAPPLWALDAGGFPHQPIRERRVDHVVVLGNRAAQPGLARLSVPRALAAILTDSVAYAARGEAAALSQSRLVREVSMLVASAPIWRLQGHRQTTGRDALVTLTGGGT